MLKITLKIVASELVPGLLSGIYEAPEGATVRDIIKLCEKRCGVPVPEPSLTMLHPLFNGRAVAMDTELDTDGTLHLCRVVIGG